ncbi:uncharacterized protein B0I36DRAFT_335251 [Microdochium trichocladiopsis]|uniref:Glycoside hydrolase superfamily n=1 Tax=Microdochium trichocladiopsis TaxID=1682393 RepID=A0A9P8XW23_9PEZI|nr:uncharacterized protein B0I36DRAFT_335251 [Microdochium trichocladiopsis]KAH7018064.1 hypothetical protein B0I36DRAFT_335251 [Microdochium trichocladiopsis]
MHWANLFSSLLLLLLATPAWAGSRGMWFWNAQKIQSQTEVTQLINFALKYKIGTLYTEMNTDLGNAAYQSFVAKCAGNGIRVQALIGDSSWATAEGFPNLKPKLDWLKQYQASAPAASRFSAVHFDVEPWTIHPDWENNRAGLTTGLLRVAEAIIKVAAEDLGNLPVEADVPFWANEIDCPGYDVTLDVWMFRRIAATHFMTYRNTPDAFMDIANRALVRGSGEGKPVWLSIETVNTGDNIQSYYGSTLQHFLSDLSIVEGRAGKFSGYAGMGIHYYEGMRALR